jgi:hypothetical protein
MCQGVSLCVRARVKVVGGECVLSVMMTIILFVCAFVVLIAGFRVCAVH